MSKKSGFSVQRVLDVLSAGKTADEQRREPVSLLVAVDQAVPRWLAACVRKALVPEGPAAVVRVMALADAEADATTRDAVIILAGERGSACARLAVERARTGVACALLCESALEAPLPEELPDEVAALIGVISATDEGRLSARLAGWLLDASQNPLAMAANFPFCRRSLVRTLSLRCAAQNAAVGAVDVIHGSDFPIMTVNELKLAFEVAAAYGEDIGAGTAVEAALVVAGALGWRGIARAVTGVLPVGSWIARAGLAFAGTMGTAQLLEAAHDGTLEDLADRVRGLAQGLAPAERAGVPVLPVPATGSREEGGYVLY